MTVDDSVPAYDADVRSIILNKASNREIIPSALLDSRFIWRILPEQRILLK